VAIAVSVQAATGRVPVPRAVVDAAVRATLRGARVGQALVSVTFLEAAAIARLHRAHLGRRGATDVLSFAWRPTPRGPLVADLYICPAVARRNAAAHERPVREELVRLVVHAALHAAGWDHPDGVDRTRSPMWRRQERLVARLVVRRAAR
jgi:probable rRNA maturation factor